MSQSRSFRMRRSLRFFAAAVIASMSAAAAACDRDAGNLAAPRDPRETVTPAVTADADLQRLLFHSVPLSGPTQGYLNSNSINPTPDHQHAGLDYGGSRAVYAPVDGIIRQASTTCGIVVLEDARPLSTWPGDAAAPRHVFLHMTSIQVLNRAGSRIPAGTLLGTSSNVAGGGCVVSGAHLHYEIRRNYTGTSAVGPTSCNGAKGCTTSTLTYDPHRFPYAASATPRSLTVTVSGSGAVTSSPAGITCPAGACSATFPQGASVTLSASPGSGFSFGGWSGACSGGGACQVTMGSDAKVTATFTRLPTEVVVDDRSSGFSRSGTAAFWHEASIGWNGHMFWTNSDQSKVDDQGTWRPALPGAGDYTVSVYIPSSNATTRSATYTIYHGGRTETRVVNQLAYSNVWVQLGRFTFSGDGSEYVRLVDRTGEPNSPRRTIVGFDAVKFAR